MDIMNMVQMINATTGTTMLVSKDRVDEYLRLGHKMGGAIMPEPIEFEKTENPLEKAGEKLKKTVTRTRKKKA